MTKQMKAAMAAMLMVGTLPMAAQTSQTNVVKVAPGQTKKTVIHRKNGATDTVVSEGTGGSARKHHVAHRRTRHAEPRAHVESATERQIRELEEKQAAQQAQIDALTQQNAAATAALQAAQTSAAGAEAQAQTATQQAQSVQSTVQANSDAVTALKQNVNDLQTTNAGLAQTISANKVELTEKIDSPLAIHYKGVTITPVGFFALESVWRQRSINSDINTPFNSTPFPGSNEGHISEFNLTGRQSRLGGLFEGRAENFKLSGYFESDFLSAGVTSNSNQSNSYTFRVRQIWGKAETNSGFAVTGGQTWTLATEDGRGTDVRTEILPNTIDPSYEVGYSWARQPGLRIQQKIGNPFLGAATTVAVSMEQAQIQLGTTANAPSNFIFGGAGTTGGLFNSGANYANNVAPDVLAKIAFDGKYTHVEIGGLARFFRDEYYPLVVNGAGVTTAYSANLQKDTKVGGGAFGSARLRSRFVDVAAQGMFGDGTARYGASQLGDVTVHPDGTLAPIRNYHGLFSLETHPSKKLDVYGYYGAEYNQRTTYVNAAGATVGYGSRAAVDTGCNVNVPPAVATGGTGVSGVPTTANCASPTRVIQEGTIGFIYKVVASPKYGTLRYQFNYSYLERDTWAGITSAANATTGAAAVLGSPRATNNMIFGGLRYYIP